MSKAIQKASKKLLESVDQYVSLTDPQIAQSDSLANGSSCYLFSKKAAHALIAALSSGRPLLVMGEPGVGKTQLAMAAARILERKYLKAVVQPQTEYHELLWSFDYTGRLADAQNPNEPQCDDMQRYICPGPVWWALNPSDVKNLSYSTHSYKPDDRYVADARDAATVLLIDEVDKADVNSLAMGLLEVLGEKEFLVPPLGRYIQAKGQPPLVIFTSNKSRELPPAFLRRCTILHLELPDPITDYLVRLGKEHCKWQENGPLAEEWVDVIKGAANIIAEDREKSNRLPRSGVAEYVDLLNALAELSDDPIEQKDWLEKLGRYFRKSA